MRNINWFLMALLMFLAAQSAKKARWRRVAILLATMLLYALVAVTLGE